MTDQPQHLQALANANTIRLARAELRLQIRALPLEDGRRKVADLLDHRHPLIQSMRVADLIGCKWIRRNSHIAVRQVLLAGDVPEHKLVRELTNRQIEALANALDKQADTTTRRTAA